MKKFVTLLAATAVLGGSAAIAQDYKNHVKARQGVMWVQAINLGTLGAMAKGEMEYDAEAATSAAKSLHATSMIDIATLFPEGSQGDTRALPAIWEDMDGFQEAWDAFGAAAEKAAAEAGNGKEALGPLMGALGGSCGGCHDDYRAAPG